MGLIDDIFGKSRGMCPICGHKIFGSDIATCSLNGCLMHTRCAYNAAVQIPDERLKWITRFYHLTSHYNGTNNLYLFCPQCRKIVLEDFLPLLRERFEQTARYSELAQLLEDYGFYTESGDVRRGKRNSPTKKINDEHFENGHAFEAYVQNLFPEREFLCLHATSTRNDLNGRMIEEAKNPDFDFQHKRSKFRFSVECKWRSHLEERKLHVISTDQLKRYKHFQEVKNQRVYMVIGLGKPSSHPQSVYCIPLDEVEFNAYFLDKIEPYKRGVDVPFVLDSGTLR